MLSGSGLGIGLYQAARQAAHLGYRMRVRDDDPGVCVEMVEMRPGEERVDEDQPASAAGGTGTPR